SQQQDSDDENREEGEAPTPEKDIGTCETQPERNECCRVDEEAARRIRNSPPCQGSRLAEADIEERQQRIERTPPALGVQRIHADKPRDGEEAAGGDGTETNRTHLGSHSECHGRDEQPRDDLPVTGSDLSPAQADGDKDQRSVEEVRRIAPQRDKAGARKRDDVSDQGKSGQSPSPWSEVAVAPGQQQRHRKHPSQRVPRQLGWAQEVVS